MTFKYRVTSSADVARLQQQMGILPEPHRFHALDYVPMCRVCFATLVANKPWHVDDAPELPPAPRDPLSGRVLEDVSALLRELTSRELVKTS